MRPPYTTPVPNFVLDCLLSELTSTELKVLLVIIRQTLGWADSRGKYGRKEFDWISGSQLKVKTGCSERAITSAIGTLTRRELIRVQNDRGYHLPFPSQRQGKVRLYFSLHPSAYSVEKWDVKARTSAKFAEDFRKNYGALLQKMRITKETLTK